MRDTLNRLAGTLMLLAAMNVVAYSQDAKPGADQQTQESNPDLAAIRAQSQAFVKAFNQHDAKAVAAFWTEDGEFISDSGQRFVGREEIAQGYAAIFEINPEAKLQMAIEQLRLLSPVTAIEDGSAVVAPAPAGNAGISTYTAVHVKVDGKWMMASVRDTWIETPPAERSAADLEWLVGTWTSEEHGIQMESVCSWVVDNHFLQRKYTITKLDGSKSTGVQMIGWNPLEEQVQSWDFSSDGGHAIGLWIPTENGWQAEVHGITGTGVPTAAINVLRRLDDNAYVWQSGQRSLGDMPLPDTNEVVIKRLPNK